MRCCKERGLCQFIARHYVIISHIGRNGKGTAFGHRQVNAAKPCKHFAHSLSFGPGATNSPLSSRRFFIANECICFILFLLSMIFYFRTYKNSERRAQRQTKTQVFRVYRKFAIFYHLYAALAPVTVRPQPIRKNACIMKTTTTIRNIRTRFLHGRNGYRVNINNVKQKATVMLQNALPERNFLPPPGERKKYV